VSNSSGISLLRFRLLDTICLFKLETDSTSIPCYSSTCDHPFAIPTPLQPCTRLFWKFSVLLIYYYSFVISFFLQLLISKKENVFFAHGIISLSLTLENFLFYLFEYPSLQLLLIIIQPEWKDLELTLFCAR
jgi:hypothetical protein